MSFPPDLAVCAHIAAGDCTASSKPEPGFTLRLNLNFALGLLLCGTLSAVPAAADALDLAEAQQLAVTRSHQLAGQDKAISAAREMAVAAGQLPDPVLKFGIDNLPLAGTDRYSLGNDFMTMRRIGIMQEITRADKLQRRSEQFSIAAQKIQAEKSLSLASIRRDAALAWLERYYAGKQLAFIGEQFRLAQLESQAAQSAYRAGKASQADLLAAESALAMTEDRQTEMQARWDNAKTLLARWTGSAAEAALGKLPDMSATPLERRDLSGQLRQHPQLGMLATQQQLAQNEVSLALANQKPDWSVEVSYQQRGAAYPNMLSVGLSLPWQWDQGKRQNRELSAKLAMAAQAASEHEEALRVLHAETQNTLNEWRSKRERLARFQERLLPLAQQRSAAGMAAYRGGKLSLGELLAVQRSEIETRMQSLQLESDAARLWLALEFFSPADESASMHKDAK